MRFFEDMTQNRIADRLGISQMHVSRLISRSCARVRDEALGGSSREPVAPMPTDGPTPTTPGPRDADVEGRGVRQMLMPHPATLRRLVDEYEALDRPGGRERAVAQPNQRAQDLAYTLCVSTGTRDVRRALERARRQLSVARQPVAPRPARSPGTVAYRGA